jgi:hypothetical protein
MSPVRKFRSAEEMNQPVWRTPGDPALTRAIRELWNTGARTSRRRYPPGVHKHRSVDEMRETQDSWAERS